LYLSYSGDLYPESLNTLNKLKAYAQSEHPEEQAKAQWPVGSHFFRVHDKGAKLFPFILDDNAYRIQISKPGKKLPMTVPSETDTTRSRWPLHPLWVALSMVNWKSAHSVLLDKYSNARTPSELRLLSVVLGALVSHMAIHQIGDRNEAIDALLKDLYAHYTEVARKRQITFDEFLAQRVALKTREFATAINSPGLVDNLRQDYVDEGAEAYRRASRGW
jgi:hypothetical protein